MITKYDIPPDNTHKYLGLSTDEKPANVGPNSLFFELDTDTVYYYDGEWKASSGGGGGNPNHVQVVEGTLADILTDPSLDLEEMLEALDGTERKDANAVLTFDASALGYNMFYQPFDSGSESFYSEGANVGADSSLCNEIKWFGNGVFDYAFMEKNGVITDLSQYASLIPATLTIYWHPMPEE